MTLKKCLEQLIKWQVDMEPEELIPYQMKLNSIHLLQKEGKFYDQEGSIPEGQGLLVHILEECHELLETLRGS